MREVGLRVQGQGYSLGQRHLRSGSEEGSYLRLIDSMLESNKEEVDTWSLAMAAISRQGIRVS